MAAIYSTPTSTMRLPRVANEQAPAIHCHGSGGQGDGVFSLVAGWEGFRDFAVAVAAGRAFISPDTGDTWGNATGRGEVTDAYNEITAFAAGPAILAGVSMGGYTALRWAQDNAANVACIVLLIPAIDLEANRVSNTTLRASIDAAWGVTYPTPLPSTADLDTGVLSGIPIQLWYANDDAVSENIGTFATAVGADLNDLGALGHTNAAAQAVVLEDVATFIATNT